MFTHVMIGSKDPERSRSFYDKVLGALGIEPSKSPEGADRHFYGDFTKGAAFAVGKPGNGEAATQANGGMTSFLAPSSQHVDAFHKAGLDNGGSCEGPPASAHRLLASRMARISAILTATSSPPSRPRGAKPPKEPRHRRASGGDDGS